MNRPKILLVPTVTELEWRVKPQLEEWAEVASYDVPGVGGEAPVDDFGPEAIVERGVAELDRRGWERCVVVGDEVGAAVAVRVAAARPQAIAGVALGHACLTYRRDGRRAPISGQMVDALVQLARGHFRTFARHMTQVTAGAYDEEMMERYIERVPEEMAAVFGDVLVSEEMGERIEPGLRELGVPLLLVEHRDCMMWTHEGFEDVMAAFPDARTGATEVKPSASPEFAALLREFCESVADVEAAPQ